MLEHEPHGEEGGRRLKLNNDRITFHWLAHDDQRLHVAEVPVCAVVEPDCKQMHHVVLQVDFGRPFTLIEHQAPRGVGGAYETGSKVIASVAGLEFRELGHFAEVFPDCHVPFQVRLLDKDFEFLGEEVGLGMQGSLPRSVRYVHPPIAGLQDPAGVVCARVGVLIHGRIFNY